MQTAVKEAAEKEAAAKAQTEKEAAEKAIKEDAVKEDAIKAQAEKEAAEKGCMLTNTVCTVGLSYSCHTQHTLNHLLRTLRHSNHLVPASRNECLMFPQEHLQKQMPATVCPIEPTDPLSVPRPSCNGTCRCLSGLGQVQLKLGDFISSILNFEKVLDAYHENYLDLFVVLFVVDLYWVSDLCLWTPNHSNTNASKSRQRLQDPVQEIKTNIQPTVHPRSKPVMEGAALGMSLLECFAEAGTLLTMAAIHHGELKTLKYSKPKFAKQFSKSYCITIGYLRTRGDVGEKCCKLLNPSELIDPKCKVCRNSPHIHDTNHLFLELPLLKDKLENITRDLKWGVPVPHERFKDEVFYVWFDAPIGYILIIACYTPEWEKWRKNPKDVELYPCMGKDNVPFRTIMFPSTLLGTDENWTLLKTISVTDYLKYEKVGLWFSLYNYKTVSDYTFVYFGEMWDYLTINFILGYHV
ncbi:hypothetical protein CTI12_AA387400 [Artemisia annua]|uniref:Methionyl/Leucyl tRNA synthetase domain-containing protein n=1 Tax=Artemisia annua TaxID=35608 RepID=A0A2U1MFT9_ARTAN|nr:hypothetical protein CTI12_AA387400 [Artemisia annua]